jgi:ribosomal protein L29
MATKKKENKKDIRQMTEVELKERLTKLAKEYHAVVSDILQGKEKNVKKPVSIRKDIARLKTFVNEKKILKEIAHE